MEDRIELHLNYLVAFPYLLGIVIFIIKLMDEFSVTEAGRTALITPCIVGFGTLQVFFFAFYRPSIKAEKNSTIAQAQLDSERQQRALLEELAKERAQGNQGFVPQQLTGAIPAQGFPQRVIQKPGL